MDTRLVNEKRDMEHAPSKISESILNQYRRLFTYDQGL